MPLPALAVIARSAAHPAAQDDYIWLPEEMRGTAIGPAMMSLLIERAQKCRFRRISFLMPESNERAIAAMERFGARREGTLRNYLRLADGRWANMIVLALVQDEVRAAGNCWQDRVEQMLEAEAR